MKRIVLIMVFCLVATVVAAQNEFWTLDKMAWQNACISSDNKAFLRENDEHLINVGNYTEASLSAEYEYGGFRNVFDPEKTINGGLDVFSFSKLGKMFLYGKFGYNYSGLINSRWRGLVNPSSSPFMMCDSIPGNISSELYSMEAGLAYPLSKHLTLGADVKYDASVLAKHKDLRNINTYMNFEVRPGITYSANNITAGLSLGYIRTTEKISYEQIDASTEKYLFELYGLWLYNSLGFSSSETDRFKETDGYEAAIQWQVSFGDFKWYQTIKGLYSYDKQSETGYNNLRHGDAESLKLCYNALLEKGLKHRLRLNYSSQQISGWRYLQRQELDPQSSIRVWVNYDKMNSYFANDSEFSGDYTFRQAKSPTDIRWEASVGFGYSKADRAFKEYPQRFSQNYNYYSGHFSFTYYVRLKKSELSITPAVGYGKGNGTALDILNEASSIAISNGSKSVVLEDELNQEFNYYTAKRYSVGADIRYMWNVRKVNLFGECGVRSIISDENNRDTFKLRFGFIF